MTNAILTYSREGADEGGMACPGCGGAYTHIDIVRAGVRKDDAPVVAVELDTRNGRFDFAPADEPSGSNDPRSSRRNWIELVIRCEGCDGGSLFLAQHKGVTRTQYVPAETTTG
ncbi:hypothetical protein [Nocardia nova]|uniref:hypothetical protein n=1 Tax=Nocardia nova TaxID=37330 RepID=UPI0011B03542|nr:hypothetical protein [Nocardia nova]